MYVYWYLEHVLFLNIALVSSCLLYTSDAADDLLCVDLGGRRIIKKKTFSPFCVNQNNTNNVLPLFV